MIRLESLLPLQQFASSPPPSSSDLAMAYQRSDPAPFLPRGFHIEEVQGRKALELVIAHRAPLEHEDFAVMNIAPLPAEVLFFHPVRELALDFFHHRQIFIRDIQHTHLGQALVQFERVFFFRERGFHVFH
jgi:hypothetical protein